jgi:hypothetical protein
MVVSQFTIATELKSAVPDGNIFRRDVGNSSSFRGKTGALESETSRLR